MLDLEVIDESAVASALLDPLRARVLASLAEPGSATSVAEALGEPRQKTNYHLRTLESHGLVRLVEKRPRRGLTERVMVASARSYVVSPAVLPDALHDPARTDRLSTRYLIAIAARIVHEVAVLATGAERTRRRLATLAIDTEIRFASATDRAAVTSLAARHHPNPDPEGLNHVG